MFLDPADIDPASPNWIVNKKFGDFHSASSPATPPSTNRYTPGMQKEAYLSVANRVLRKYFELDTSAVE